MTQKARLAVQHTFSTLLVLLAMWLAQTQRRQRFPLAASTWSGEGGRLIGKTSNQ